jgi:hypothetical protein
MSEITNHGAPNVQLEGGPVHQWDVRRYVPDVGNVLKLCHGSGYEHCARTNRTVLVDDSVLTVFTRITRTYVAE